MSRRPTVEVVPVDAADDQQYAAFHAAYWEGQRHGLGDLAPAWTAPEMRAALLAVSRRARTTAYAALDATTGEVLGTAGVVLPLLDNLHRGDLVLDVRPAHRRRGVGTALLAHLERVVLAAGRRRLRAEVVWPWAGDPDASPDAPGLAFATARGWTLDQVEVRRELEVPVDPGHLDALAAEAAPHHAAYRLESWVGPVPDRWIGSWLRLASTLMTQAPNPDAEAEPDTVDVAVQREADRVLLAQGRRRVSTVALDETGEVVAHTDVVVTEHEPGRCYQWGTLVRPDHRGHRLGLAVKTANLDQLARADPGARSVVTFNAESNGPMVAINARLGFVAVARLGEVARVVGGPV